MISFKQAITFVFCFALTGTSHPSVKTNSQYLAPKSLPQLKTPFFKKKDHLISSFDQATIYYQVRGNPEAEKTIVMLHGLSAGPSHWKRVLKENPFLLKNYRIILPTVRGHGWFDRRSELGDLNPFLSGNPYLMDVVLLFFYLHQGDERNKIWDQFIRLTPFSEKRKKREINPTDYYKAISADLKDILDAEDVVEANFIGHSMGGEIARHFYSVYPERVKRLVLIATFARYPFFGKFLLKYTYPIIRFLSRQLIASIPLLTLLEGITNHFAKNPPDILKKYSRLISNKIIFDGIDPDMFNRFLTLTLSANIGGLLLALASMGEEKNGYSKITIPTLVVEGKGDGLITGDPISEFERRIPPENLTTHLLNGRHFPQLHDERFPHILEAFLNNGDGKEKEPAKIVAPKSNATVSKSLLARLGLSRFQASSFFLSRFLKSQHEFESSL